MTNYDLVDQSNCGVGMLLCEYQQKSNRLLKDALKILSRLDHRGGRSFDGNSSDGVGILTNIPHKILASELESTPFSRLKEGSYHLAQLFVHADACISGLQSKLSEYLKQKKLDFHWRKVVVDSSILGSIAQSSEPICLQLILSGDKNTLSSESFHYEFEELLSDHQANLISICDKSVVYKGLCLSDELASYYDDLKNPMFEASFAIVHQRFSTNTNPIWSLAQPFRKIAHNGEINTIKSNYKNLVDGIQGEFRKRFCRFVNLEKSDSYIFDRAFCHYTRSGKYAIKTLSQMMPPEYRNNQAFDGKIKSYFDFMKACKEAWEGPALIAYFNHDGIGAHNDKNGLRPSRFARLKNGFFYLSSEMGALDFPLDEVIEDGRLSPGEFIHFDFKEKKILKNEEILQRLCAELAETKETSVMKIQSDLVTEKITDVELYKKYYRYTQEELEKIIKPMAVDGKEAISSMGTDTPLAIFSQFKQPLYNFFKQIFAQVTNPPIDAIREKYVTDMERFLGPKPDLDVDLNSKYRVNNISIDTPVLSAKNWSWLSTQKKLKTIQLSLVFDEKKTMAEAIDNLAKNALRSVQTGCEMLMLSDKFLCEDKLIIPPLLAISKISNELSKHSLRSQCSIVLRSAEVKEVHHVCCLLSYGLDAVYPWLLLGEAVGANYENSDQIEKNIINALHNGILKVMSKMGISTLNSYVKSENMEIIGLDRDFAKEFFPNTNAFSSGLKLNEIESLEKFHFKNSQSAPLKDVGLVHWRKNGEARIHNPQSLHHLRQASFLKDRNEFKKYCENIDSMHEKGHSIRGLLKLKKAGKLCMDEVEFSEDILKRFSTGAMSLGSISKEAHETIADAMNSIGAKSNSGEGGEDKNRLNSVLNSKIKQVASGRFGVDLSYLASAEEIQIKIAQGAKPGEGGQLPGHKVDVNIAAIRRSTPGVTLISPPPHHDIYSIEDLAQLIHDLKNANPLAKINVKLVSSYRVGTIACGVAKAGADVITISGYEGGTGASPLSSIKHAGLPFEIGLSLAHNELTKFSLRDRVLLETDGLLRTPTDIIKAILLGADRWCLGSAALIPLGCIMMRKCHLNTCPVGIATQNPYLRSMYKGKKEHLINFLSLMAESLRHKLAELGLKSVSEAVGRRDLLSASELSDSLGFNLDFMTEIATKIDYKDCKKLASLEENNLVLSTDKTIKIENIHRSVGTSLSYELLKKGSDKPIKLNFEGFAGQSFMAFAHEKLEVKLEGYANDYLAKGLSGASVAIRAKQNTGKASHLVGNTALYGASSGELFIAGSAGERFAVRNSGANAVVEGVGLHGLEYMTGGRVVILGSIAANFAAGMSGGYAYIWKEFLVDDSLINKELVYTSEDITIEDEKLLRNLLNKHYKKTGSNLALNLLGKHLRNEFIKIVPHDYERAMKKNGKTTIEKNPYIIRTEQADNHELI